MSKEQDFLTALKNWLLESLLEAVSQQAKLAPVKVKVRKTVPVRDPDGHIVGRQKLKRRKYTKRSDFWKGPHPRKKS